MLCNRITCGEIHITFKTLQQFIPEGVRATKTQPDLLGNTTHMFGMDCKICFRKSLFGKPITLKGLSYGQRNEYTSITHLHGLKKHFLSKGNKEIKCTL